MSGIDLIIEKIISQANKQADNELKYVNTKIDKQFKEQQKRFKRTLESELAHAKVKAQEEHKRVIAGAKLESRKNLLQTKVDLINEVFDKTLEHLMELSVDEKVNFLTNVAKGSLIVGNNELMLNDSDTKDIGSKLVKQLSTDKTKKVSLCEKTIDVCGGLVIRNDKIQTNLTYKAILRVEREKLEGEVVKLLF
ncbi:MAG: hypothetical protein KAG94_02260 [Clostridiales bacterium]|nr:hypothetical protein [Clostridiales bacterium]